MTKRQPNSIELLRTLIQEIALQEVDIEDVEDVCYTAGSTHVMNTCKIGGKKYFLKFSDEELFEDFDPSLQILIEYLAYRIYGLFAGVNIPSVELVFDKAGAKVGLASTPAPGQQALRVGTSKSLLGKMMSKGVYVDIFLANWDVVGSGSGNVFFDDVEGGTRIDPGGSLTFRAQGGRKGKAFGSKAGELKTMLDPGQGAGVTLSHADLKEAAATFLSVSWDTIQSEIDTVRNEVDLELEDRGLDNLRDQWDADCDEIKSTLSQRHADVLDHARYILKQK